MKSIAVISVFSIIAAALIFAHPAYAHNFGSDESAIWLSKVQNLKAEMSALKMDLSDSKAVAWHVDKLGEYWNANDTKEMGERNQLLAKEIPDTINAITTAAQGPSPNAVDIQQNINKLDGYLDESISARLDKTKLQNATVQGLAVTGMISETLEDYGDAIGTSVDLNNMSYIMNKMSGMSGMSGSGGSSSGTSGMSGMSSSGTGTTGSTVTMTKGAGANQNCVSAKNCFDPSTLTVSVGATVEWKNDDQVSHTVTSGSPSDNTTGTIFDSSLVGPGKDFKFTFDKAGTYDYFCQVHPWMTGQVIVKSSGGMSGNMGTSYSSQNGANIHYVMDMQSGSGSMGTSDTASGTAVPIVNTAAYHSAQMLSTAAKTYYEQSVMPLAPSDHSSEAKTADQYFGKLVDAINNKADVDTVMTIVHLHLHTSLIPAFGLPVMEMSSNTGSAVPEFPMPVVLTTISLLGVVMVTMFRKKLSLN